MMLPPDGTDQQSWRAALARDELADLLDRLFCHHLLMVHWSLVVSNRLTGTARLLLRSRLQEDTHDNLEIANRLAERVTQLGGVVTADPCDLIYRAPMDTFELPQDPSDLSCILEHSLALVVTAINAQRSLLDMIGSRDTTTRRLVEELMAEATARQHELQASLSHDQPEGGQPFAADGGAE